MPPPKQFAQFNGRQWREHPEVETACKYVVKPTRQAKEQLLPLTPADKAAGRTNYSTRSAACINDLMCSVHQEYVDKKISKAMLQCRGKGNPAGRVMKKYADIFERYGFTDGTIKESLAQKALQILYSRVRRNEKEEKERKKLKRTAEPWELDKNSAPKFRNGDVIYIRRGTATDMNPCGNGGKIRFYISKTEYIECVYFIPERHWDRKKLAQSKNFNKQLGGNLVCRGGRWDFIVLVHNPIRDGWLHEVLCALGIDLNKEGANYCVLSDGSKYARTPEMDELIALIRDLNASIADCEKLSKKLCWLRKNLPIGDPKRPKKKDGRINRAKRHKFRMSLKAAHKKMKRLCMPIAAEIIAKAKAMCAVLCIDTVKTGQKNGTFGQDAMQDVLVELCQQERVPYVLVPTRWTTVIHAGCGKMGQRGVITTKRGKSKTDYNTCICSEHGPYNSHENAAKVIAEFGWMIWQEGYQAFLDWRIQYAPPAEQIEYRERRQKEIAKENAKEEKERIQQQKREERLQKQLQRQLAKAEKQRQVQERKLHRQLIKQQKEQAKQRRNVA